MTMLRSFFLVSSLAVLVRHAARSVEAAANNEDEHKARTIVLAGLSSSAEKVSTAALKFMTEMSCLHGIPIHIVGGDDILPFYRLFFDHAAQQFPGDACAAFQVVSQPAAAQALEQRVDRLAFLRDYQKDSIHSLFKQSSKNEEEGVVILADLDLLGMPDPEVVVSHAQDLMNCNDSSDINNVDVLCSLGILEQGERRLYYDTYATGLLPDTFVYSLDGREIKEAWPSEDPAFIIENGKNSRFTAMDLLKWFEDAPVKPVPVRSCFGGLALYRASAYFNSKCGYRTNRDSIQNAKYRNMEDQRPCEHAVWKNCMHALPNQDFTVAVHPDLKTLYHEPKKIRNSIPIDEVMMMGSATSGDDGGTITNNDMRFLKTTKKASQATPSAAGGGVSTLNVSATAVTGGAGKKVLFRRNLDET